MDQMHERGMKEDGMSLAACVGGSSRAWHCSCVPKQPRRRGHFLNACFNIRVGIRRLLHAIEPFRQLPSMLHRLRRPKNARYTLAVNLTRQITTLCVAATIAVGRRGLGGGLGRRGSHEFGSPIRSSAVAQRSDHGCIPPTLTAHPATLANHEELGCNTATKYAFDAPLFVLARSSDDCHVAACEVTIRNFT